jgi:SAM-dependent methyltransferase/uncharacterized protein YbaR (Trm112 family)
MQERMLPFLRCPVSRSHLKMQVIKMTDDNVSVDEGILFAEKDWFFPIIGGIPRMTVEAFLDYEDFLRLYIPDYSRRRNDLEQKYQDLIAYVVKKNKRTKDSFSMEWSLYDYQKDRTWEADPGEMLQRFLEETDEHAADLLNKTVFDVGCGNGQLDSLIAGLGAITIAMDLSRSIERAYRQNTHPNAWFLQGDLQFPPVAASQFDLVHCSGVLHHTNDTALSFRCLASCVGTGGKLSVWLYHPRADRLHNLFNQVRTVISRLPARWQYRLLYITVLPVAYIWKRLKGTYQNKREMMIALMDQLTPEFRREHTTAETAVWFEQRGLKNIKVTTTGLFGFNMIGIMDKEQP